MSGLTRRIYRYYTNENNLTTNFTFLGRTLQWEQSPSNWGWKVNIFKTKCNRKLRVGPLELTSFPIRLFLKNYFQPALTGRPMLNYSVSLTYFFQILKNDELAAKWYQTLQDVVVLTSSSDKTYDDKQLNTSRHFTSCEQAALPLIWNDAKHASKATIQARLTR